MRSLLAIFLCTATSLQADVAVRFDEGAPKDRFTFTAAQSCLTEPVAVTIDLSGSDAGLIFDVSAQGQGVEVFQPFELVAGKDLVTGASAVVDGDTALTLQLAALPAGQSVAFTIDLDDTIGAREITVSNQEIMGATVTARVGDNVTTGVFGADAQAVIPLAGCTSYVLAEIRVEPADGALPRKGCHRLVIARGAVIVKSVVGTGIEMFFEGFAILG